MQAFTQLNGLVAPLDRANVDTDAIIPKQFLKSIKRSGFGVNAFDEWRYLDHGEPGMDNSQRKINPDFVLNKSQFQGASILLTRENFGCGSSREHAPWALEDFGFKVIIASSYADIFYNNCFKNGMLPIALSAPIVDQLFSQVFAAEGYKLNVDLSAQTVTTPNGESYAFEVDAVRKYNLLNGLDDIGLTMQQQDKIKAFETKHKQAQPWLFI
jgi:3-isopropylmalate/(R)-2-methylmalate dehydratase small subunit